MSKKNKRKSKKQSRCEHCGKRNKYALEHWKGRDKTRCKKCGEFLTLGIDSLTEDSNICKEVKTQKMEDENNISLYEAIRPVRNNHNVKKGKKKWWVIGLFMILIFGGWGVFARGVQFFPEETPLYELHGELIPKNITLHPLEGQELCGQVKAVPSWSKNEIVIGGGYRLFKRGTEYLIENNITFLYSSSCDYCNKIIEEFGEDWQKYIDSGLTKECW